MKELERNGSIQEVLKRSNQHELMIGFIGRGEVIGNIQAEWTAVPLLEIRKSGHGYLGLF